MNRPRLFFLACGILDTATGWGLLLVPQAVQEMMLVADPLPDPSSRIVGAFVAGVGTIYLWGAARPGAGESRLRQALALTAILRGYVGLAFLLLVITGKLQAMWLLVAFTDLALALTQAVWCVKQRKVLP